MLGRAREAAHRGEAAGRREVFVGRAAELAILVELAERAACGRGRVVLIAGEAGVGKTALVEQLAARTSLPVRWGTSWQDGQPPYWPWVQLLRGDLPVDPPASSPLSVLAPPGAGAVVRLPAPEPERFALYEAVLAALVEQAPAMLVLDDLHWVDTASAGLLLHVSRSISRLSLLVVAAYRDTDVPPGSPLQQLIGPLTRLATTLPLDGLTPQDVAELLVGVTGGADPRLAAEVHLQSDGNALFAAELARLMDTAGALVGVPTGLAAVIGERLADFDPESLAALEAAAVLGLSGSIEDLSAVLGRPVGELLDAPMRARVLRPGTQPGEVCFRHALVRAALLERLGGARRIELHAAAVHALAGAADHERVGRLAAHAVQAVPVLGPEPAVTWSRRAAEAAAAAVGYAEAAAHLAIVVRLVAAEQRAGALLDLGRMLHKSGDTGAALQALHRAVPLAREQSAPELFVQLVLAIAQCLPPFAAPPEIMALLDEAQQHARAGSAVAEELTAQRWMRVLMSGTSTPEDRTHAEEWASGLVARASQTGDAAAVHRAWSFQYPLLVRCDRVHERLVIATGEARLADRTGELGIAADAGVHLLLGGLERADRSMVDDGLRRLAEVARLDPRPLRNLFWLTRNATVAVLDGVYGQAARSLDAAEQLSQRADLPEFAPGIAVLRACLAYDTGAKVPPAVTSALTGFFAAVPVGFAAGPLAVRALLADGEEHAAAQLLSRVLDAMPEAPEDLLHGGLAGMAVLAELVVRFRYPEPARRLRAALTPYAEQVGVIALAVGCVGPVAHALGVLASYLGDAAEADRWFATALDRARALRSLPWQARTQAAWARALRDRDPARAAALSEQVQQAAVGLGMGPLSPEHGAAPRRTGGGARLDRDGDVWVVEHDAVRVRLRATKGLTYLAELVTHPGVDRRALDLVALVDGHGPQRHHLGDAGPGLDAQAKAAYRRRLAALRAELDAADAAGTQERSAQVQAEIDALVSELSRAVGLGGRDRPTGSAGERARLNVTRALRSAISRIGQAHPALGQHLNQSVHTGMLCCYAPDEPVFNIG